MNFKKFLFSILLCIGIYGITYAQIDLDTLTPRPGDKQVTFGVANNSGLLVYKKHKSNKHARRMLLSGYYTFRNSPISYRGNQYWGDLVNKDRRYSIGLGYGFQNRIAQFKKLEPYYGMDFVLNSDLTGSINNFVNMSSTSDPSLNKITYSNGISIGVSALPFIGFNYYILDRLAIGAEYRVSLINASWNSGQSSNSSQMDIYGHLTYASSSQTKPGYRIDGGFSGYGAITASIFLNKQK